MPTPNKTKKAPGTPSKGPTKPSAQGREKPSKAVRTDSLREALPSLPSLNGRPIAATNQLARLCQTSPSGVRHACLTGKVRRYELPGATHVLDAEDLLLHYETTKVGRPKAKAPEPAPELQKVVAAPVSQENLWKKIQNGLGKLTRNIREDITH